MHSEANHGTGPLRIIPRKRPRIVLIANAKGGCGKTTLATNMASWFANHDRSTALMDFDPQGSSAYWLKLRPQPAAPISGISAFSRLSSTETRSFHNRLPRGVERVVVDSPAGLSGTELYHRISEADLIVVPILPSPIDIHSATNFIRDIQITGCLRERKKQVLVIANRVRRNTVMFGKLNEFLQGLGLPRITYTRDSQLYIRASALGLGIADIHNHQAEVENEHWTRIGSWIENQFALQEYRQDAKFKKEVDQLASS